MKLNTNESILIRIALVQVKFINRPHLTKRTPPNSMSCDGHSTCNTVNFHSGITQDRKPLSAGFMSEFIFSD